MVTALFLLCYAAAELAYGFRQRNGQWELLLDGKISYDLPVSRKTENPDRAPAVAIDPLGEHWRNPVDAIRRLPASDTDKQLYIAFLKRKFGYQIAAVNHAYGLEASAFTELESSDFGHADRAKLEPDDIEFTADLLAYGLEEARKRVGHNVLLLAVLSPDAPLDLARRVAQSVDAFLVRDRHQAVMASKPYVLSAPACATVRPPSFAACARISEP